MGESIIVALITGALSLLGVYLANRKSAALMEYRLEQLEKKVDKHNNLVERMYAVEEENKLQSQMILQHSELLKRLEAQHE